MTALTDDQVSDLKAKFGDELRAVTAADGSVCVFRPAKRAEYNRWVDKSRSGSRSEASMELAQSCVVPPDQRPAMTAMLDKYPAMLLGDNGFVDAILEMAGAQDEAASIKKL